VVAATAPVVALAAVSATALAVLAMAWAPVGPVMAAVLAMAARVVRDPPGREERRRPPD